MINNVVLMGRLTAEPELRHTATDKSVVSFTLAVDSGYKDRPADFIDCVAWDKTAEFISNFFGKGRLIAVTGAIQTRMFTDKNGNNRKATEVNVTRATFTGEKRDDVAPAQTSPNSLEIEEITDEEDLPFD